MSWRDERSNTVDTNTETRGGWVRGPQEANDTVLGGDVRDNFSPSEVS